MDCCTWLSRAFFYVHSSAREFSLVIIIIFLFIDISLKSYYEVYALFFSQGMFSAFLISATTNYINRSEFKRLSIGNC